MYRNVLLSVHIACVAAWLGCNFTQFFLSPWFTKRGGDAAVAWPDAHHRAGHGRQVACSVNGCPAG